MLISYMKKVFTFLTFTLPVQLMAIQVPNIGQGSADVQTVTEEAGTVAYSVVIGFGAVMLIIFSVVAAIMYAVSDDKQAAMDKIRNVVIGAVLLGVLPIVVGSLMALAGN